MQCNASHIAAAAAISSSVVDVVGRGGSFVERDEMSSVLQGEASEDGASIQWPRNHTRRVKTDA